MSRPGPKQAVTAPPLDLSALPRPGWRRVDAFAREYLRVPKGTGAGTPFRLRKWQLDIVKEMFPQRGPRPRQGLVSIARGNGKTALAAVLALYGLFADEQEGAQVLVVASDERQARHVFNAARRMIELEPRLAEQVQVFQDRIYLPCSDSTLAPLPAEPAALQGWDPTLAIVDELGVVSTATWEAMALAAGKRERSLTLAISTPADSTESVMWQLVAYGRENPGDASFRLIEYASPEGCQIDDERAWKIGNPALNDFLHVDAMRATLRTTREPSFRRYRLGQWVGQVDRWLPWGSWEAIADRDRVVGRGERVWLAFDGSASGDSTALIGCTANGHLFVEGLWEAPGGDPRWRVPREHVADAIRDAFARYDVAELSCDPWGWRTEIEGWAKRFGPRRVVEFNTGAAQRMAPATDRLYQAVVTGACSQDGSERFAAHMGNAVAKPTPMGDLVSKDKKGSPRKIDAAVAAIVAYERRCWYESRRRGTHRESGRRVVVLN